MSEITNGDNESPAAREWVMSRDWDGHLAPPELIGRFELLVVGGSQFARFLNRVNTNSGSVVFPRVAPVGSGWVQEGERIPTANLNDSTYRVAAAKLAVLVDITSEMLADSAVSIAEQIADVLRQTMSFQLDQSLLYGSGEDGEPSGLVDAITAPPIPLDPDLRASTVEAWGQLLGLGANVDALRLFCHPSVLSTEWRRYAADSGLPAHQDSPSAVELTLGPGVPVTPTPALDPSDALLVDTSRVHLITRSDFTIEASDSARWEFDVVSYRIKGRWTIAAPHIDASVRRLTAEETSSLG